MRFMEWAADGGQDSGVKGFFLWEIKPLCSVLVLHFNPGTREAFHSHAFNALTWWLKGGAIEHKPNGDRQYFGPSLRPKFTSRDNTHKVESLGHTWALSFRGPWKDTWQEIKNGVMVTLTHGRKVVAQ